MLKIENYKDLQSWKKSSLFPYLSEEFENIHSAVGDEGPIEEFEIGEDPGPIVIFNAPEDYKNFEKNLMDNGLSEVNADAFETGLQKVVGPWIKGLVIMNDSFATNFYFDSTLIPKEFKKQFIAENKQSLTKKINEKYF